jgi:hypothetical protein
LHFVDLSQKRARGGETSISWQRVMMSKTGKRTPEVDLGTVDQ